ncbi:flagellar protein FlgN [Alteriqipengyuania sp. 357]
MIDNMLDIAQSLASLMSEETGSLGERGRMDEHEEMVAAKRRLVAQLEAEIVRLNREVPGWVSDLNAEQDAALTEAMATLRDAAVSNATMVDRHLAMSNDIIDAIAAEAKRLTGNAGCSYLDTGSMMRRTGSSPISVNTRL